MKRDEAIRQAQEKANNTGLIFAVLLDCTDPENTEDSYYVHDIDGLSIDEICEEVCYPEEQK